MLRFNFFISLVILCFLGSNAHAAYVLRDSKLMDVEDAATLSAQEHFKLGQKAHDEKNWKEAARHFRMLTGSYPNSPYASEAHFYLGKAYYQLGELDYANNSFSDYLKIKNNPRFFQEAVEHKAAIAHKFSSGAKRRILGTKRLPKWASGHALALQIYDEVIAALPSHSIAARALYAKGALNWKLRNYRDSVDAYQMVIKRFPKDELAPESYVAISKVYREQSKHEFQNPDVLAFAEINLRRFKQDFPRENRLKEVEDDLLAIKEIYAQGLCDTGKFYERTHRLHAAVIYYHSAVERFPETQVATECLKNLERLGVRK